MKASVPTRHRARIGEGSGWGDHPPLPVAAPPAAVIECMRGGLVLARGGDIALSIGITPALKEDDRAGRAARRPARSQVE